MTEYKLIKLPSHTAQDILNYQRHTLRRLRSELAASRNPYAVRIYMDFARLSIICAKRGYMCTISD